MVSSTDEAVVIGYLRDVFRSAASHMLWRRGLSRSLLVFRRQELIEHGGKIADLVVRKFEAPAAEALVAVGRFRALAFRRKAHPVALDAEGDGEPIEGAEGDPRRLGFVLI